MPLAASLVLVMGVTLVAWASISDELFEVLK
jgi:hypothetical protein